MESSLNSGDSDIGLLIDILKEGMQELVICLSHSWGGLEQVAAADAVSRGALGIRVRVLVLEGSPIHEHLAQRKEVIVLPLDFRPRDYFDLKLRSAILRLIAEGVNLIHTHQTSLLGSLSPWLWRVPHVVLIASRHIMNNHDKRNFFHAMIYRRLDALVVMSQTLRRNVLDTHPLKDRQVKVVKLGLDFEQFDPERTSGAQQRALWGADEETVAIGLVGRIDPAKGQAVFLKAAAGLLKTRKEGEKFKFIIVGEETLGNSSNYLEELKEMVRQFRLEDFVVFAGYQENMPEVMRAFDVFVMPSRQEAFGLVAIEAMAMESAIIISSGGSSEEIVGPNLEFGMTVRPEDAFDLQKKIRYLLDNPMERVRIGQRAREQVKKNYDRRLRIQHTLELYERSLRIRRII